MHNLKSKEDKYFNYGYKIEMGIDRYDNKRVAFSQNNSLFAMTYAEHQNRIVELYPATPDKSLYQSLESMKQMLENALDFLDFKIEDKFYFKNAEENVGRADLFLDAFSEMRENKECTMKEINTLFSDNVITAERVSQNSKKKRNALKAMKSIKDPYIFTETLEKFLFKRELNKKCSIKIPEEKLESNFFDYDEKVTIFSGVCMGDILYEMTAAKKLRGSHIGGLAFATQKEWHGIGATYRNRYTF